MDKFIQQYTSNLISLLNNIDTNELKKTVKALDETIKNNSKIYVIGNGGSSSTASHMANDLGIGLKQRGIKVFDISSLVDNVAVANAIANDIGFEDIFYMQLKDIIKPEDILIAISCSGNSPNIVKAVEYAHEVGSKIIGLSGFDGGRLKQLSHIKLHIQTEKGEYGLVEDMHMILNHILFTYYQTKDKNDS